MISRRDFLQTSALGGLAIGTLHGATPWVTSNWIDAHVHVWTPDTKKYPIASSFQVADMVPASFTPEELFSFCKPEGVTKVVLIQMSFYGYDNQYMLDCMEKHPGVFSGVAVIDETKSDVVTTMKKMNEKGVRGFRIYADLQKASGWQDSSGTKQMWSHAADSGQSMCLLANPDALPLVIAMCERFPKTRVVVDHFARIGVSGAIVPAHLDNLCRLSKFENVFVKTSAFYALGKKQSPYVDLGAMIQRLVGEFGANRLMWASDCPYQVVGGHNYQDSIGLVRDKLGFLTQEDKKWMLGGTAEKVFF
jgi:predicted TIM-barrel fold metal-dependent hydrolase